ncbi:MAG: LPXTG cell wall anchor domain-containing protein, partial [Lachnospiraceae bacterium]|nr:LPXTG cell wall anchor domain-containing protein [Lachnospiraceae bacterium]
RHAKVTGDSGQIVALADTTTMVPPEDIPATGVNTPYALVMTMMLLSGAGLISIRGRFSD